jgi:ATP-dependent RNA helicase SUPV3L1/SUV3
VPEVADPAEAVAAEAGAEAGPAEAEVAAGDSLAETGETALGAGPAESAGPVESAGPFAMEEAGEARPVTVEMETFYTFVWAPRSRGGEARGNRNRSDRQGERAGNDRGPRQDRHRPDRVAAVPAAASAEGTEAAVASPEPERPPRTERAERPAGGDGRRRDAGKDRGGEGGFKGKPRGKGGNKPQDRTDREERSNDRPAAQNQPKTFEARPPKTEKIDPDNPFAVLAALRLKS